MSADAALSSALNSTTGRLRPVTVPPWIRVGFQLTRAISPAAGARLASKLFFHPPRTPVRPEERAILATGQQFRLNVNRHTLVGHAWGEGPAVFLVHGWGGHAGHLTPFVQPLVEAGFRPVALDLPAHGESEGEVASIVHFEAALVRAAALFGPVRGVVAHSFGAASTAFALSRGFSASRAVFFASPARFDSFWTRFRVGLGVPDEVWERMIAGAESWLGVRFAEVTAARLAATMTTPLLVFHDPKDHEVAFEEGEELVRHWPGARLVPVSELGHRRILSDPECLRQTVAFIEG